MGKTVKQIKRKKRRKTVIENIAKIKKEADKK